MKDNNPIRIRTRCKELLIDYIFILIYLVALFIVNFLIYMFVLGGVPEYTRIQLQLIATIESVIPIVIIFSLLDYRRPFGSYGKRKAGLEVHYKKRSFLISLLRNGIKFLPWQLAHIGVIDGIYTDFTSWVSIIFIYAGLILGIIILCMGFFRKDKRHLGDMIAQTQVVQRERY